MKVSVCIESDSIKTLVGKMEGEALAISEWHSQPLPAECVAGGVVVSDEPVRAALAALKTHCKAASGGVSVVIGGGSVLTKKATVPQIQEKKLYKLIESEFANMAQGRGELLYDYMPLRRSGAGMEVLCAAAEKSFIASYLSLFEAASVKVRSVGAAVGALANLAGTDLIREKTCIVCVADGNTLNSTLFVDGAFAFNSASRLFSERGTRESFEEIAHTVSSLVQFNAAEKNGRAVSDIYFGGLRGDETASGGLLEHITQTFSVSAQEFGGCAQLKCTYNKKPFPAAQYLYCIGNLYEGGRRA